MRFGATPKTARMELDKEEAQVLLPIVMREINKGHADCAVDKERFGCLVLMSLRLRRHIDMLT